MKLTKRFAAASLSLAMLTSPVIAGGVNAADEPAPLYTVSYYSDAEKTQQVKAEDIKAGDTVYYTVDLADGVFYTGLTSNASYTDDEKITFGDAAPEVETDATLACDITLDGKLDVRDLVRAMKYIAMGDFDETAYADPDFDMVKALFTFDTNFDGEITVKDLVRAMKLLSGTRLTFDCKQYNGARLAYTEKTYYSAVSETVADKLVKAFGYDTVAITITSAEQFAEYFAKMESLFDFNADLLYVDEESAKHPENYTLPVEEVKAKYNAEFFEQHSLIICNFISLHESVGPKLADVVKSGAHAPMLKYEADFDLDNIDTSKATGPSLNFSHTFIETDKLDPVVEKDAADNALSCWFYMPELLLWTNYMSISDILAAITQG